MADQPPQNYLPYGYGQPPQSQLGYPPQAGGVPGYPPQAGVPGYPPQAGVPGYPPQAGVPGYPPQAGVPGYPPQAGVPGYLPQAGDPRYPQAGIPGYPPQAGVPGYPPQAGVPGYPPQAGVQGYPPQAGVHGYPPQSGVQGYPPQAGAPGYPPQAGVPGYPQAGVSGYPPQAGVPEYTPQAGAPGYPPQAGAPGYPQAGAPGYPPQAGAPGYPQAGAPGYPPQAGAPGYPQAGAPGYPQAGAPGYPQTGAPGYPQTGAPGYPAAAVPGYNPTGYPQSTPAYPHAGLPSSYQTHPSAIEPPTHGTVNPIRNFDPEEDSRVLRKAMKGLGTDEKTIIDLLAKRSNAQRIDIMQKFKVLYGRDLISDLKSELSGNFENLVLALFQPAIDYDCQLLRKAMKGAGTDEITLIEILASRSNQTIVQIKQRYRSLFSRDLEKDLVSETSGHFKRLLVSLAQGSREEGVAVDQAKAAKEAQDLFDAGERKWGTDESCFNQVLALRSFPQLRAIFEEYKRIAQRDILSSIDREMSGDLKVGMQAVVKVVMNKSGFFAERLYKSMKGLGTDDDSLIMTVVTRCEVDMVEIKHEYMKLYKKTLATSIISDCSGDYKELLVALVGRD